LIRNTLVSSLVNVDERKKKKQKIQQVLPFQTRPDTVLAFLKNCCYNGANESKRSSYTHHIQSQSDTDLDFLKNCGYSGATLSTLSVYTPLIKDSVYCSTFLLRDQIKAKGTCGIGLPFQFYNGEICYSFSACLKNLINLHNEYLKKTNTLFLYKDQKKNLISHMSIWKTLEIMKLLTFQNENIKEENSSSNIVQDKGALKESRSCILGIEVEDPPAKSFVLQDVSPIDINNLDGFGIIFWQLRYQHTDDIRSWKYNGNQELWISLLTVFICLQCICTCDKKCNNLCNFFRLLQEKSQIFKEFFTVFSTDEFRNFDTNYCYMKPNFMDTRRWDKQRRCYNQPTPDDFLPHMNTVKFLRPDYGETKSFKMWRASKDHSKYWIPAKTVRKVSKHWERHNGSLERATIVCSADASFLILSIQS